MEKVNSIEFIQRLRNGETPTCPECGEGVVSTENDPQSSHFFCCDKCSFMINID